jgi:hypothetical protein
MSSRGHLSLRELRLIKILLIKLRGQPELPGLSMLALP